MLQEDIINIFESKNLQFLGKILQSGFISLVDHNFHHLLTNQLLLWSFGVASSSNLLGGSLCEANAKHSNEVSIACFGLHKCLNEGVPLLDESAQLVSCDVHSVEVGVAIKALDFFDLQLHLSPGLIIAISVQISQRYFKDTSFQTVSSDLYKRGLFKECAVAYFVQQFCCKEWLWVVSHRKQWVQVRCTIPSWRKDERYMIMIRKPIDRAGVTYTFFFWPFFLKFLGFFPAVMIVDRLVLALTLKGIPLLIINLINRFHI